MNVWSGAIALNGESHLEGIRLYDPVSNGHVDISKDSTLSFRCFVNPALIPLCARAGGNLELHTTDVETSQWLKSKFLSSIWLDDDEVERIHSLQCPVGILINVDGNEQRKNAYTVSDLLIYGVLSSAASFERPPTPASSSPDLHEHAAPVLKQELRIYAAPLSSTFIEKAHALPTPPRSPANTVTGNEHFAEFLPDLRSPSPKRKRVATLFEAAAQHHRRVRQKGGEAVSQLMAHKLFQTSQQLHPLKIKRESEEPSLPALERIASQRSRSLSLGGSMTNGKPLDHRTELTRPSSNRGHPRSAAMKRSTPNPFSESVGRTEQSPALPSFDGNDELFSTPKDAESIIAENKNVITRTILTCMRLYGFNRTTTRLASTSKNAISAAVSTPLGGPNSEQEESGMPLNESISTAPSAAATDEDEFRAMYHATYRASTFALRKYLKEAPGASGGKPPVLEKEKATTIIDEFLRLFCEEN